MSSELKKHKEDHELRVGEVKYLLSRYLKSVFYQKYSHLHNCFTRVSVFHHGNRLIIFLRNLIFAEASI